MTFTNIIKRIVSIIIYLDLIVDWLDELKNSTFYPRKCAYNFSKPQIFKYVAKRQNKFKFKLI